MEVEAEAGGGDVDRGVGESGGGGGGKKEGACLGNDTE